MRCTRRDLLRGGFAALAGVALARAARAGTETARFRVLHAAPSFGAVDVYGNRVRVEASLGYGKLGRLWSLPAESVLIRVFRIGADPNAEMPLGYETVPLSFGRNHTIVIAEEANAVRVLVFPELDPPPRGQIALRVVHVAPGAPALDLARADGTVLLDNIPFGEARAGVFAPGNYVLRLQESGTANVLLNLGTFALRAGARRTFYVLRVLPTVTARGVDRAPSEVFVRSLGE